MGEQAADGSAVVVVGHSNTLLWGCVQAFADDGADVLAVVPDGGGLPTEAGAAREVVRADVADEAQLRAAAARLPAGWPPVRALVNCHSDVDTARIESASSAAWVRVLTGNLVGPLVSTLAFLPLLKQAGSAAVVHIGSIDGQLGNAAVPSYSVSKGGLIPLTHMMADEFAPYGIRVNCVARAALAGVPASLEAQLAAATPLRRVAEPAEVAAAVRFLASAEASYITGTVLPVDGGRTAITPGTRLPTGNAGSQRPSGP